MTGSEEPAGGLLQARHHESLFYGFFEAAPDAAVIIDGSGRIVQVNQQTEKLFGYDRAELVGRPMVTLMPERFRNQHVGRFRAYVAHPRPQAMGRDLNLFGLRKDGDEVPIDVSVSPLPSEEGLFVAGTIRDVTSHRVLEDELQRRARELEEADRQKDQFLSAVVHELRSPLSVLTMAAQILRQPQADRAVREKILTSLERQTAHMVRLVEDLLDVSRVRRGMVALHREAVDVRTVLSEAVEMSQSLVASRGHRLEVTQGPEPLWVAGDSVRLIQVVNNLLTNAAKYTPDGGHIWLSAAREGDAVAVRIRDDGEGIPKEMLSRVFEMFTQLKPSGGGKTEGLGIGLAVAQRLVAMHGGSLGVFSEGRGRGSEFVVRLPSMPDAPDPALSAVSGDEAPA